MGKLIRLELFNFKSYKGHHVMLFGDSYFTSIIGPNGSGKSNSMDAISFVLGIKSSHLRSSHLRDLVYRGRVLQQAEIQADGTATDGHAAITAKQINGHVNGAQSDIDDDQDESPAILSTQNDTTTAWVMAVYEDDAGDEQAWKRSITAAGSSEYRINNRVVTAKDYNDALEAEQILIKARNFLVFQGDVEAIASQSSKDLTRLIEQISGSLEFKTEYDKFAADSEKAIDHHNAKLKQRRTLNAEAKQYQEQKEEADKYIALQRQVDQSVVTHVLWKLYHFQQTIETSTQSMQKHQDELLELRRNAAATESRTAALRKEQAAAVRHLTKAQDTVNSRQTTIQNKENSLLPVTEKIKLSEKKVATVTKRINDITVEQTTQQSALDKLRKDLANVEKAQSRWEADHTASMQRTGRELSAADLQEYDRIRAEVSKQTVATQNEIDTITRSLRADEESVANLARQTSSSQSQTTRLETEVTDLESRLSQFNASIASLSMELDDKKKTFHAMQSERVRNSQKRQEVEEKLQEVLRHIAAANVTRQESQKEARARETVAALKRLFPGVLGQLSSLVKPKQKKYGIAVGTVLGRNTDAIVVETEKTAKDCILHLRQQRSGQATFIPLDTIVHRTPDASLRSHEGTRLAMDTIDYDSNIERAIAYACGDALVCDNLQIARHICYERKIDAKAVTLDGIVISKGGNMTGGQGPDQRKERTWGDADLETLHRQKDKLLAEIGQLPSTHQRQDHEETLQGELTGLEAQRTYAQDELSALTRNLDGKRKELKASESELRQVSDKHDKYAQVVASMQSDLEAKTATVSGVEDQLFASFCQRLGFDSIRAYDSQHGDMQREAAQKKLEFTTQRSKLSNQANFEQQRLTSTVDRIKRLQEELDAAKRVITESENEKETLDEELDTLRSEFEAANEQLEARKNVYAEKGEELAQHRREAKKRENATETTSKALDNLQQEVTAADLGRYNVLKLCRMRAINIPLTEDSTRLESLPLEEADPDEAMDIDASSATPVVLTHDYGIQVDFDDLDEALTEHDSPSTEKQLLKQIDDLTKELESKAPNSRAVERLDNIKKRVKEQEAEFNSAHQDMLRAKHDFEQVRDKRLELFSRAYEHISNRIDTVYKDLTRTENFQLGGSASLTLEGDEDAPFLAGIKYHAMPPLKRFRDMEHLSGGEKTMAALALLFAIHNYVPSPFFVLDEVDAALDNANTSQLANYLRTHARPGMQFVVISLKTALYQTSETLVGVMRDQGLNSSRALTLDLRKYRP